MTINVKKMGSLYKKVLVVDDESDLTTMIKLCLKSYGCEVAVAGNGRLGLEKAETFRPDLIFLDILMPEMDGWEFCRRIHQHSDESLRQIPIVIMTALLPADNNPEFEKSGAQHILIKPFKEADLFYILQNPLNAHKNNKIKEVPYEQK